MEVLLTIYHLHASTHSRGAGKGAGGHARYVLRDGPYSTRTVERVSGATAQRVEVSRADEVAAQISAHMPAWVAADPLVYWDAADAYERANGTVYREIEFALPDELTEAENVALARRFAEALAQVDGGATPYTLAIHRSEKNPALLHGHLMLSDKVNDGHDRNPELWFRRAANRGKDPATGGAPKTQARIAKDWLGETVRPLWSDMANRALERAGIPVRVDHRSLDAQRREQEILEEQAREKGDELGAVRHHKAAAALDRLAQPKRGRVLEHGGPERAPGQAQAWERHLAALAERQAALEAIEAAEQERQRLEREIAQAQRARQATQDRWTERRQQRATRREMEARRERLVALADALAKDQACRLPLRQAYLDAGYQVQQQGGKPVLVYPHDDMQAERLAVSHARQAWEQRKQGLKRDSVTERETRPGVRHPEQPRWQAERERILTEAYGAELAEKLGRWYRIERQGEALVLKNAQATVTDHGDRVTAGEGNEREIEAMVELARAKGWERVSLTGTAEFQARAARAFVEAGIGLTDARLEQAAREAIEADRREAARERAAREREAALVEQQERETRPSRGPLRIRNLEYAKRQERSSV